MNKIQPFTPDELTKLKTPVREAFERMRCGTGEEDHFHTLAAVVNVSLIRSESIDPFCVETCQRAQAALMAMRGRFQRLGKWGFDSAALQDLPPVIDLHEQLLQMSTPLQMADAMQITINRMESGQTLE